MRLQRRTCWASQDPSSPQPPRHRTVSANPYLACWTVGQRLILLLANRNPRHMATSRGRRWLQISGSWFRPSRYSLRVRSNARVQTPSGGVAPGAQATHGRYVESSDPGLYSSPISLVLACPLHARHISLAWQDVRYSPRSRSALHTGCGAVSARIGDAMQATDDLGQGAAGCAICDDEALAVCPRRAFVAASRNVIQVESGSGDNHPKNLRCQLTD